MVIYIEIIYILDDGPVRFGERTGYAFLPDIVRTETDEVGQVFNMIFPQLSFEARIPGDLQVAVKETGDSLEDILKPETGLYVAAAVGKLCRQSPRSVIGPGAIGIFSNLYRLKVIDIGNIIGRLV